MNGPGNFEKGEPMERKKRPEGSTLSSEEFDAVVQGAKDLERRMLAKSKEKKTVLRPQRSVVIGKEPTIIGKVAATGLRDDAPELEFDPVSRTHRVKGE
jgi:hypothetical protein